MEYQSCEVFIKKNFCQLKIIEANVLIIAGVVFVMNRRNNEKQALKSIQL